MTYPKMRTLRSASLIVITALACSLALPSAANAASSTDVGADYIFSATNAHRDNNGRDDLLRDGSIDNVAQAWAQSMLSKSHSVGRHSALVHNYNFGSQIPQTGLKMYGENIGYSCGAGGAKANAAVLMNGWKKSSGHNRNMLNSSFSHIGIGYAYESSSDCAFGVQDFGQYSGTFVDVPANAQFAPQIEWMVDENITTGYSDGKFRPKYQVTREAFAAFLYRAAGSPSYSAPSRSPFKDLSSGDQFYREINWLASQGITTGYKDGTFRPKDEISREAIAAFFYRAAGSPSTSTPKSAPFDDVPRDAHFAKEILWLSKSGITTGYSDGTFKPYDDVSREATAAFLYRAQ